MDLVIQLLFALALLSLLFQVSQWETLGIIILAITIGLIAYFLHPWTVEQSKEQLETWLEDPIKMQNLAVIQVIEALIFIGIDLALLKKYFGLSVNKYIKYGSYFPGLFWMAAVLYLQMISFYSFSTIDFDSLAIYFSMALVTCFVFIPLGIKKIIPENYLRMELRYTLSFGQVLGGVVITIFCQRLPYRSQLNNFELTPLLIVLATTFSMVLFGWLWSQISKQIKLNGNTK